MFDCFEHVALVDRWIVDYFSRIIWKHFEAYGTVGNGWVDGFILERYGLHSAPETQSSGDNLSGGMLELRSKLLIHLMYRLSSGGSGARLYSEMADGSSGSLEKLTELEEAVDFLEQIVNAGNHGLDQSDILQMKLMLKQQAVYVCCREERFDLAAKVFHRLWRNWKTEKEMELRQNIAEVLDSRNRRHMHLEAFPYSTMIEKCKGFLRKIYNNMATPFLMNAADNVWRRMNLSPLSTSEQFADRLQAAERKNQSLGLNNMEQQSFGVNSSSYAQQQQPNVIEIPSEKKKHASVSSKKNKAETHSKLSSVQVTKVESKPQVPAPQVQPQTMMPNNCPMLFWTGSQLTDVMPISMDGSGLMMSDQRQPMLCYVKGEKSAVDDWSDVIAPGPSGLYMDPGTGMCTTTGNNLIYLAPQMQMDQSGMGQMSQMCMDPFQIATTNLASNMAIQNNVYLSTASATSAATVMNEPQVEKDGTEVVKKMQKARKGKGKKGKKRRFSKFSRARPSKATVANNLDATYAAAAAAGDEQVNYNLSGRNVIGTVSFDRRISRNDKFPMVSLESLAPVQRSTDSAKYNKLTPPGRKVAKPVTAVPSNNVALGKRNRWSEPEAVKSVVNKSLPTNLNPSRRSIPKPTEYELLMRGNPQLSPPAKRAKSTGSILMAEETFLTKNLRSKVVEINVPNSLEFKMAQSSPSKSKQLPATSKNKSGTQKKSVSQPAVRDGKRDVPSWGTASHVATKITDTKIIVKMPTAKSLSPKLDPRQGSRKSVPAKLESPKKVDCGKQAWTVAEEIQLCKGIKRLGTNNWSTLCQTYLPHRGSVEARTKWEKMSKAKKNMKQYS